MDWGFFSMEHASKAAGVMCVGSNAFPSDSAPEGQAKPPDCTHILLRPRLRFGFMISVAILMTDVVLRFSWTLRFFHQLFPSADAFVLCTQFLEVFRYVNFEGFGASYFPAKFPLTPKFDWSMMLPKSKTSTLESSTC